GGSTHQYAVRAVDADGNSVLSRTVTATATAGTSYPYADQVMRVRPAIYYPLGSETKDWAGDNIPVFGSANSAVTDSAVGPGSTGATSLNGTANGWVANNGSMAAPMSFSAELWFKTSTTTGGRLLGFGASKTTST